MFTNILETTTGAVISDTSVLLCIGVGVLLGFIIRLIYIFSDPHKKYSGNFAFSLAILPVIVTVVIMVVGSDIARAI